MTWLSLLGRTLAILPLLIAAALGGGAAHAQGAGSAGPALPALVGRDSVAWDLVFEAGNRRCRLFFHDEPRAGGYTLSMPAGCRKALPMLDGVTNWLPGADEHVTLRTEAGASVIDFAPEGGNPYLSAVVGRGDTYTLAPVMPAIQEAIRAALATPAEPEPAAAPVTAGAATTHAADEGVLVERGSASAAAPRGARARAAEAPVLPMPSVGEVAGHYAVLRDSRDTGCMVTLDADGASRGGLRARLAPACRDQGIVIFDPTGWRLTRNALVLQARRGHTIDLVHHEAQTWTTHPERGAALVLKRL